MLVVMALGGNALLRRGQPLEAEVQRRNLLDAVAKAVAPIARRHQLVITHGNGPQIGLLALQAAAYKEVCPYPLDVLGAESEGMIGYLIEQALSNELPGREIATLLTQVEVDSSDPAFAKPSKPIGPIYGEVEARELSTRTSWTFMPDALLLLTDVPAVWTKWPMSAGRPIGHITPRELRTYAFEPGSMAPKVEAACRFAERTGRIAGIGAIDQAEAILAGGAGTIVAISGGANDSV